MDGGAETDTSILHHAFMSIFIALWAVITHYISILMAILSYFTRFTVKRGNAGRWNSGWKRSKYWKPMEVSFGINKNYWAKETPEGAHTLARRVGGAPTPTGRPLSPGPPGGPPVSIFRYMKAFTLEKIVGRLMGRNSAATRRNLGGTNLGLWQSCSVGDTSLREGEIITNVITNDPLIGRGSISINIFTSTISPQTLVHLLYPILYPKPQIGTCGLLVVLITPCSWYLLVYLVEDHMFRSLMHINKKKIMNMSVPCE